MNQRNQAEKNLEVIRSLMERATVYRTISSSTAFAGGFLAILAGVSGHGLDVAWWQLWITVLFIVVIFNTTLVVQKAAKEKKPVFSSGLKLALRAILPPLLTGGAISALMLAGMGGEGSGLVAATWMIFYGLALMATGSFSPRSLWVLGAVFVVSGIVGFASLSAVTNMVANFLMGGTFGIYHVAYGLWVTLIEKDHN